MNFRLTAIFFAAAFALLAALLAVVLTDRPEDKFVAEGGLLAEFGDAGVSEAEITAVEMVRTEPGEQRLVFTRPAGREKASWSLTEPFPAKVDSALVDALVHQLYTVKPANVDLSAGNLTTYGLNAPTLRVTLKGGDKSVTLAVGNTAIGGAKALTYMTTTAAADRPVAVLRSAVSNLFRADTASAAGPAWQLAKWVPDYRLRKPLGGDLRDPAAEATAIKLSRPGREVALARNQSGAWAFTNPPTFGEADDAGDASPQPPTAPLTGVRPLLNAVAALQVAGPQDFLDTAEDPAKFGLGGNDPDALRVELVSPAGKEVLTLGKPAPGGGGKVYARLDGDTGVMLVQADRLDALKATLAAPGELRNKNLLPPADKDRLDAIDLTVGATTVKLRRFLLPGNPVAQWVQYGGAGGPTLAKLPEVNALIGTLARPRASREVLAAPDNAAFAGPETKATIKVWAAGVKAAADPKLVAGTYPPEPPVEGTPTEFVLGRKEGDAVFVRRTLAGQVTDSKVPDVLLTLATRSRLDWIDPQFQSFNRGLVTRLTFNRGAELYDLERNEQTGAWSFAQPAALKGRSADVKQVSALADQLAALTPERVVSEQPTPEELKRDGLDPAAPRMRVTVTLKDDVAKTRVYEFGNDTADKKGLLVRQAGRAMVVQAGRSPFDALAAADLRDPVLYRLDPAQVTRLKIRGYKGLVGQEPLVYNLEKRGGVWTASPPNANPDQAKVNALVAALSAPVAERFVGQGVAEHGTIVEANPDAIEFTLDSANAPTVALVLGARLPDGKVYAAPSVLPSQTVVLNPAAIRPYVDRPTSFQK